MNEYILVVDQGSSSSRCFAFDLNGKVAFYAKRELRVSYPEQGFAEYEPRDILRTQTEVIDRTLRIMKPGSKILGLGIASQRSTIVLWDRNTGVPLCPALSWQDGRSFREAEAAPVSNSRIHAITGLYKTPYYSASKIVWCMKNYPAVRRALERRNLLISPVASFILWHLSKGGIFAADPTLAQRTLLFNIHAMQWDKTLLDAFGISAGILPQIKPTFSDFGEIQRNGFKIPVRAMMGDQQSAMLGLGIENRNTACLNYGTGAFLLVNTGGRIVKTTGLLNSIGWQDGFNKNKTVYFSEGTVNSCATVLEWLKLNFGFYKELSEIDAMCAKSKNRIFVLPAIGGIGSPHWDYRTFTTFTGLTAGTDKNDLIRGCVEGICFMVSDIVEAVKESGVKIKEIKVSGGVSNIDYLLQFQSDVTGLKVVRVGQIEATAAGLAGRIAKISGSDVKKWKLGSGDSVFFPRINPSRRKSVIACWKNFLNHSVEMSKKITWK
ncbi:MAG: hypothetical protein HY746_01005 [Elusimicrobia bacterium]|nr:hypothetical protein [Elusimicrobiota bacterium]